MQRPSVDAAARKKLPPGLEVWDVTDGAGAEVKPGGTVTMHYTGWLTDDEATKFEKAEFPLGNVIEGWQGGIPGMKPGGVRRRKSPADLGYGAGRDIPPNATLIFEVQLISAK